MHPSALNYARTFFEVYGENLPQGSVVLDIGAQNVNGSIKDVCPDRYQYVGVDFVAGNGVDVVLDDPYKLPFEAESVDAIVCSSCFEHSEMFWLVFNEMMRILKPTGLLYINAPSNGYIHRWPVDCWRFYPDSGNALVTWAKRSGYEPVLLESFIGHRADDTYEGAWNDFVAVFGKSHVLQSQFNRKMVHEIVGFDNARLPDSSELHNLQVDSQDFRLISQLSRENSDLKDQLETLTKQKIAIEQKLLEAQHRLLSCTEHLSSAGREAAILQEQMHSILKSNSWRLTAPMRILGRALRGERPLVVGGLRIRLINYIKPIYWKIPVGYRKSILNVAYKYFGFVFRGVANYELWKSSTSQIINNDGDSSLILLDEVDPIDRVDGNVAIHIHIFYNDLVDEFSGYLKNMPFAYDLYVSVKDAEGERACLASFADLKECKSVTVQVVENRGRDIAPMLCTFGESLRSYDYIAHLHSKKSLYNGGATEGWRQYLSEQLLGSPNTIRKIFSLLKSGKGIIYPQNYKSVPYYANTWLANKSMGAVWCARLGIAPVPTGYFDYPAGSMFWARGDALQPLFNANITINDFTEEAGQTDGTFAHCLERLLVLSARKQGLQPGIIKDLQSPSWSPWRLDQSINRPLQTLIEQFANSNIKCIGFDIFDTLLIRPLIDAESTKRIVAANLPAPLAELFAGYRVAAEGRAREQKGRDVNLDDIYKTFQQLTRLSEHEVDTIRTLEEEIEYKSLAARSGGVELFEAAKATGKSVVLISDMFLPEELISRALHNNGIYGWSSFYLSNKVGLRKDSGQLYDYVLKSQQLQPHEMIMVGDNERSDFQIPSDKKIVGTHVLRPTELARGTPRLRRIVEKYEFSNNLNVELTLGQIFSKNFSSIVYPNFKTSSLFSTTAHNIGYSLVGPMLTCMSQWLFDKAAEDGVERLYFLAREGQLMKCVYDLWAKGIAGAPPAEYLVVSRRACGTPLVQTMDDIYKIAKDDYYQNTVANFLLERFGLDLDDNMWSNLQNEVGFGKNTLCQVHNQNLDQLMPLIVRVADAIFTQACEERKSLMLYLESMSLLDGRKSAVVDVGYGGTIQNYLCQLTGEKIQGYYLATDVRSISVAEKHEVKIRGCYVENAERNPSASSIYLRSFELEKLLSSNDGQVIKYISLDAVTVEAVFRELSHEEVECKVFRDELQNGVMEYVKDAIRIRTDLLPTFSPSFEVSKDLATEFFSMHSNDEVQMLSQVLLDDHYCGRGVV